MDVKYVSVGVSSIATVTVQLFLTTFPEINNAANEISWIALTFSINSFNDQKWELGNKEAEFYALSARSFLNSAKSFPQAPKSRPAWCIARNDCWQGE